MVYNKKTLSIQVGISYKVLQSQLKAMLKDKEVRKKFRSYNGKCFTPKQIEIIKEELGYEL